MDKRQCSLSAEVGLGAWGDVRSAVRAINFYGGDIKYFEGSGLISREFRFRGNTDSMTRLIRRLAPIFEDAADVVRLLEQERVGKKSNSEQASFTQRLAQAERNFKNR